jgi:transcriptional regulator with XRE-family HTH domain
MPQTVLAERSGLSAAMVSMLENGHRELSRISDVAALSAVLGVSPAYLAFGIPENPGKAGFPAGTVPFPAMPDAVTARRHERLAGQLAAFLARGDGRAAGEWLRRTAREPGVNPWLLIDQLRLPGPARLHGGT